MSETRFEIILKDGTELVADLLEVSDDQDLALLKLDGYRTPFLNMDPSQQLSQGVRVFAIGNPLGMQDAVTSGVVTQITPEYLLTDTQILPGSSGGPLILESGEVIGINVSRQVAAGTSKYAAGFGKVIPIALALQSFPDELSSSGLQDLDAVQSGHAGPDQAQTLEPHWTESLRVEPHAGPALDRLGAFGRGDDATSDATPVRLIVPDQEESQDPDTAPQLESRSLDFPPVGGGIIPSGISRPRE
ncbi:MAG: serine protease [Chromatiaceae bacterium]|nr:serine protease [Chromatiaceae bacterium]